MRTRALWVTMVAVVLLAAVLIFRWAERDGRFNLEKIYVTGLGCGDTTAVAEVVQRAFGMPLHRIDADSLAQLLCGVPGVRAVNITLIWPSSAHLDITLEDAAVVLETPAGPVPVNMECSRLPQAWLSGELPVIRYTCEPDSAELVEAVAFTQWLGSQRDRTLVLLDSTGVNVMENEMRILLGSERLEERWLSWGQVRPLAAGAATVDLRFRGQAVFRRSS